MAKWIQTAPGRAARDMLIGAIGGYTVSISSDGVFGLTFSDQWVAIPVVIGVLLAISVAEDATEHIWSDDEDDDPPQVAS
jgi:hypothetical protein